MRIRKRQPSTFAFVKSTPLGSPIVSQSGCENRLTESTGCARGNGGPVVEPLTQDERLAADQRG